MGNLAQELPPNSQQASPNLSPSFFKNIYIVIVIFILIAGFGGYYIGKNSSNLERSAESTTSSRKDETITDSRSETFKNNNIQLSYSPKKFNFNYEIFNTFPEGPLEKQTQRITLSAKNNMNVRLIINFNMEGLGGVCTDFPENYRIEPFVLDGVNIFKAKYIGEEGLSRYNPNWPTGNIYLVMDDSSSCPNVAGLESTKNGPAWIEYDLGAAISDVNSQAYLEIEKELDQIVSSIKGFWR